uniref:Orofacial cleft 1 candidate 1 n=1 Tax=Oryzias latipes TaxID=8090 RepID=A0A3P9JRI1_ORYLA
MEMDTSGSKLQQKALQQPKQKKSKSAEFLMGSEESDTVVGIDNPAFDGEGSTELSIPPTWLGRKMRGDRPDSTLAAHHKKMELQAPAKERAILNADENRLYERMAALLEDDDTSLDIPGTLQASRDDEVLEVKAGDLSADSACSSSSLPGKNYPLSGRSEERSDPCREGAEGGNHCKKKPIKKTNSCGPSMSGRSAPPRQADKQKTQTSTETLSAEDMEEYTFSLQSAPAGPSHSPPHLSDRVRIALCMLRSELDLPLLRQQHQQHLNDSWHDSIQQLGLIMLLLTLMWFVRLYLHYCSQWLYLQAIAVPVNKFCFHAHTVELVYQSSLLHTREELAMVMVGPLTLNAVTFLLVLIRWGCQLIFGSLPSFMSKFIMAQGVWTVLDPLAVFAVDAVLGHLIYSPDVPVGDAAKLYWHFYRADRSGAAGVFITLFLYAVHFLLSITILSIYLLRFHNDGRMLDVFQRLTAKEGKYFLPQDLELSNQELSYIVKKAEQWRGFNGERRKVAVYDYVWTTEDVLSSSGEESHMEAPPPPPEGETSTHVIIYTLYVSGLKQRYRHFLRQPDGAIVEVIGEIDGDDNGTGSAHSAAHQKEKKESASLSIQLRKRRKPLGRFHRMEPLGGSGCGSSSALQDLHE